MSIPEHAKRCPYCHHFQNTITMLLYHPGFAVIFAILPMVLMLLIFGRLFERGEDYEKYANQITITDTRMVFGEDHDGGTVDVLGTLQNRSPVPWKEILFQVDFRNAEGLLSDTLQREGAYYYLPASNPLSFKVFLRRHFPATNYVNHVVRVVTAKDGRARW